MSDLFLPKIRSLSGKAINLGDNLALTGLNFNLCLQDSHKCLGFFLDATCFAYICEFMYLFIYSIYLFIFTGTLIYSLFLL